MGLTRSERIALHKKQERLQIKKNVPAIAELTDGVPALRSTPEGLVEYVKHNNVLYKKVLDRDVQEKKDAPSKIPSILEATRGKFNQVGIGDTTPSATLNIKSIGASYSGTPTVLIQDTGVSNGRATLTLESLADEETDFLFRNNNRRSWSISTRNSASTYNLQFYSFENGTTPVLEGNWDTVTGVLALTETHTSDIGLKENIVDLSDGITKALALKPRTFDWKRSAKGSNNGFIAQEVEEVLPDDVHGKDWSEENPDDWKSINVQGIVAVCIKAIQELSAKVEALENS